MELLLLVTLGFAILPMFGEELILFSADDHADSEDSHESWEVFTEVLRVAF